MALFKRARAIHCDPLHWLLCLWGRSCSSCSNWIPIGCDWIECWMTLARHWLTHWLAAAFIIILSSAWVLYINSDYYNDNVTVMFALTLNSYTQYVVCVCVLIQQYLALLWGCAWEEFVERVPRRKCTLRGTQPDRELERDKRRGSKRELERERGHPSGAKCRLPGVALGPIGIEFNQIGSKWSEWNGS